MQWSTTAPVLESTGIVGLAAANVETTEISAVSSAFGNLMYTGLLSIDIDIEELRQSLGGESGVE